jgi:hypothetical protein
VSLVAVKNFESTLCAEHFKLKRLVHRYAADMHLIATLGGNMTGAFGVVPAAVDLSSLTESGISVEMAATTSAGAAALTGVVPMAADADSAGFAEALNATGATYLATAAEHVGQRTAFASAQTLASSTYLAMEAIHGTALGG